MAETSGGGRRDLAGLAVVAVREAREALGAGVGRVGRAVATESNRRAALAVLVAVARGAGGREHGLLLVRVAEATEGRVLRMVCV